MRDEINNNHADAIVAHSSEDARSDYGIEYMTTVEAARYMRHSTDWLLRQKDIPFYRGKPNLYLRKDLDAWLEENRRYVPLLCRRAS